MTLPASFLLHVEQHPCLSGCFGSDPDVRVCLDPCQPLTSLVVVSCRDCFARFGVPAALLPSNTSSLNLADQVTHHLRAARGFSLSLSGYFTAGPGFWLSAAYYNCGLFLIDGNRSRAHGNDLDLLMLAFRHNVLQPVDPQMTDPKQYTLQTVHINFAQATPVINSKQALLSSSQVRLQPALGWQKVTLAEFLPISVNHKPSTSSTAPTTRLKTLASAAKPSAKPVLKLGDICPTCGAEVKVRSLLNDTFIGCMC